MRPLGTAMPYVSEPPSEAMKHWSHEERFENPHGLIAISRTSQLSTPPLIPPLIERERERERKGEGEREKEEERRERERERERERGRERERERVERARERGTNRWVGR